MVLFKESIFLFEINIPFLFFTMCFMSLNIITGLTLAKDSSITFGCASVNDGSIKILFLS